MWAYLPFPEFIATTNAINGPARRRRQREQRRLLGGVDLDDPAVEACGNWEKPIIDHVF
jgi:hypothetical protein